MDRRLLRRRSMPLKGHNEEERKRDIENWMFSFQPVERKNDTEEGNKKRKSSLNPSGWDVTSRFISGRSVRGSANYYFPLPSLFFSFSFLFLFLFFLSLYIWFFFSFLFVTLSSSLSFFLSCFFLFLMRWLVWHMSKGTWPIRVIWHLWPIYCGFYSPANAYELRATIAVGVYRLTT